jgi:hypothetical protein
MGTAPAHSNIIQRLLDPLLQRGDPPPVYHPQSYNTLPFPPGLPVTYQHRVPNLF